MSMPCCIENYSTLAIDAHDYVRTCLYVSATDDLEWKRHEARDPSKGTQFLLREPTFLGEPFYTGIDIPVTLQLLQSWSVEREKGRINSC